MLVPVLHFAGYFMIDMTSPRTAESSETVMHELVLPPHTNALGTAFGGAIMSWIDICGAICAQRHTSGTVVTASIDQLDFQEPVRLGDVVRLTGRVSYVGRTSLEVRVRVDVLNNSYTEERRAAMAFVTFVAVDENSQKRAVPPLDLTDTEDQRRFNAGLERRTHRLEVRARKLAAQANEPQR